MTAPELTPAERAKVAAFGLDKPETHTPSWKDHRGDQPTGPSAPGVTPTSRSGISR